MLGTGDSAMNGRDQTGAFTKLTASQGCGDKQVEVPAIRDNMRPLPARVSREVPRSILKFEMLLGTLDATPNVPQYTGLTPRDGP